MGKGKKSFLSDPENKKFITKLFIGVLVVSLLFSAFYILKNTVLKENISWSISDKGVLTISGTGAIKDFDPLKPDEWHELDSNDKITKIIIGEGITEIGDYAFYKCGDATSVVLPKSLRSVGNFAFMNCSKITEFVFKNGLTDLGEGALYGCSAATVISLPKTVKSVGYDALYATAYYNEGSNWKNGILYSGTLLIDSKSTASGAITVRENTTLIADYAFCGCKSISSVTMAESTVYVGKYAFSDCSALTDVRFGKKLDAISEGLFWECKSLKSIHTSDNWLDVKNSAGKDWNKGVSAEIKVGK